MTSFTNGLSRRRLLQTAGLSAVAGSALWGTASCSTAPKEETSSGKPKTFTVYWNAGHAYKAYDKVIAEFEKAHGLTVTIQKQQWPDLRTRLLADFASGNVPDVVENPGGWPQEFAISGDALSLQKYVDSSGAKIGFPDDWQPVAVEQNTYEGKVYGIQLHLTDQLLLFNQDMLDKAKVDPPTTWEQLVDVAKKLTTDKVHGLALNQDASYGWPFLLQAGARYYDPKTKSVLQPREAAIEALQFQADLVHKHKVSPVPVPSTDYSGPQKLLSAGRAAMIFTGPWDLQPIEQTSPDLKLGVAPALKHKRQATISAGSSVFVPAKAKNPDLSWDFISRITALDVEKAATEETGMLMPRKSWAKDPAISGDPTYSAFADAFAYAEDYAADILLTGKSGEVGELYKTLYQGVVMKNQPVEPAVEKFAKAAERLLGNG